MAKTRLEIVQNSLRAFLASAAEPSIRLAHDAPIAPGSRLHAGAAVELFRDQVASRLLDVAARELRKTNQSFYTISSAGHEQNAVFGALLRADDPCFLHYRSGGLMMARSRLDPACDPILDGVRSFCASADDPISGGRHKVWGSRLLWVPPQTSTIASRTECASKQAGTSIRRESATIESPGGHRCPRFAPNPSPNDRPGMPPNSAPTRPGGTRSRTRRFGN
jgi:2-oxoisovalerate dehydrogenase E1 component